MCVYAQTGPGGELQHWIDGSYDARHPRNVFSLMGGLLAQRMCLATNKRPKTPDQLVQELRADVDYVNETLQLLLDEGIMAREGEAYRANFPALAAEDWQALTGQVRTWARAAVHCLYGDGALPAPPQPAPVTWAFFGWEYGIALTRW